VEMTSLFKHVHALNALALLLTTLPFPVFYCVCMSTGASFAK